MNKMLKPGLIVYCLCFVAVVLILMMAFGLVSRNTNNFSDFENFATTYAVKIDSKTTVSKISQCNSDKTLCTNDCDDSDPLIFPGASEYCDNLDNNCNGIVDEGCEGEREVKLSKPKRNQDLNDLIKIIVESLKALK